LLPHPRDTPGLLIHCGRAPFGQNTRGLLQPEGSRLSDLTVLEADRWEILEPLQDEWNRLLAESVGDTIFLRHEWLRLWWKHFGSGRRLAVFLARRGSRLVAALPLMEVRSSMAGIPVTTLQSLTNYHSFRFNALCAPGEEAAL